MPSFVVDSAPGPLLVFLIPVVPSSAGRVLPETSVDKLDVHVFPGKGSNVTVNLGDGSNGEVKSLNVPIGCDAEDEGLGITVVTGVWPDEMDTPGTDPVEDDCPSNDPVTSVTSFDELVVSEPVTVTLVDNSTLAEDTAVVDSPMEDAFLKVIPVNEPILLVSVTDNVVVFGASDNGSVDVDSPRDCVVLSVTPVDTPVVLLPVAVSLLVCSP